MANIIKIKRSTTTATPSSLAEGELAYSEDSSNLFIGTSGSNLVKIGGNLDVLKLSNIEANATADQSAGEILTLLEDGIDSVHYKNGSIDNEHLADDAVSIAELSATGTASSTTFLRGDNTWGVPIGGVTSVNGVTGAITAANIATAVEAASGSNTFTDADHTKLNAIEASADVTDTTNVVAALTAGTGITISGGGTIAAGPISLTTVQTAANETAHLALTAEAGDIVVRSDENKTYCHNGGTADSMADYTLLATPTDAVLSVNGVTGAITAAHIATAVEAASGSNTFTDADHSKLNAIEASADVTDTTNVTAAGALMDSEVTNLADVKAFDTTDYATAAQGTTANAALPKAGGTMTGNTLHGDNVKDTYGAGADLQIYHDGSASYIEDSGTGNLKILADNLHIKNAADDEYKAYFDTNGGAALYHDNSLKIETASSGVAVSGNIAVTGTVDGVDIATRDAILTSTTTTAGAALPKAGGTMTGDIVLGTNTVGGLAIQIFAQDYGDTLGLGEDAVSSITGSGGSGGYGNVGIGKNALKLTEGGAQNIAVGNGALQSNVDGDLNVAMGDYALYTNTGSANIGIGTSALRFNTTANYNVAVGWNALLTNTTGAENTAIGYDSLGDNTTGTENVSMGHTALSKNTTGTENTAIGHGALKVNTTGENNTAVGEGALNANTTADGNTAVGQGTLYANTTGTKNVAVGDAALGMTTIGDKNVGVGNATLYENTTGEYNTALGTWAMYLNTTASYNTAVGMSALGYNTTGAENTAVGYQALKGSFSPVSSGSYNTASGYKALIAVTTGTKNIGIGYTAGDAITTGSNNTIIGDYAGTATLADTVAIYAGTTERLKVTSSGLTINGSTISNYTHPTSAGNKHIPTGGATGQFLGYSASGTAAWTDTIDGGTF